jgi:hypothetical protein
MNLSLNGTGYISQNGTGVNNLNTIELNSGSFLDLSTNNTSIKTTAGSISNTLLGYIYGASSNIQEQISNLASQISGVFDLSNVYFTGQTHFSKNINLPTDYSGGLPTSTQLGYIITYKSSEFLLHVDNTIHAVALGITAVKGSFCINWSVYIYGTGALNSFYFGLSTSSTDFSNDVGTVVRNYDTGYISFGEYKFSSSLFTMQTGNSTFYILHKCDPQSNCNLNYTFEYQLVRIA